MTIKAVLFDHDGTLVNSEGIHFSIWRDVLKSYGVDFDETDYKDNYAGIPTPTNAVRFIQKYRISDSPEVLIGKKESATDVFLRGSTFPLMKDVVEVLEYFYKSSIRMAVVTGAGKSGVMATLKGHKLERYFEIITSGDDVVNSKPSPDVYLHAMEQLGLSSSECVSFEDTENGVRSASAAGLECCAIPNEYSMHHDFSLASNVVENLSEARLWVNSRLL